MSNTSAARSLVNSSTRDLNETQTAMAAVRRMVNLYLYISRRTSSRGFDYDIMSNFQLVHASGHSATETHRASLHPTVTWRLVVKPHHTNLNNVLHGGCYGVIFDMATMSAMTPVQKEGYWDFMAGVIRTLNISFLKAVPVGTTILVKSRVAQHGRTMCLITGELVSEDGLIVYATCKHHKVHVPMLEQHIRFRDEMAKNEAKDVVEGRARL